MAATLRAVSEQVKRRVRDGTAFRTAGCHDISTSRAGRSTSQGLPESHRKDLPPAAKLPRTASCSFRRASVGALLPLIRMENRFMAKGVRFHEVGAPEVLRWESVEIGEPGRGEVRIRHLA